MTRLGALVLLIAGPALAQTGVSDDRVSLPEGPGSLEGVGENAEVDPNMGLMSQTVGLNIPEGYGGMTPPLELTYSSGAGNGVPGMGWSIQLPAIERLTKRGLPRYGASDEMAVNGAGELVRIPDTDPPVYRARFEGAFVRYTWYDAADGREGYWLAEYPDGRRAWFGADRTGTLVADARVGGTEGTFRWHVVDVTDRYDHRIHYTYAKLGNVTLPLHVGWVFQGEAPFHEVTFNYEEREDEVSDCKPGFEEVLRHRLKTINVFSNQIRIRRYELSYEDYATSGGFSRLTSVTRYGRDGGKHGAVPTFTYTQGIGDQTPVVSTMGTPLGVDIAGGNTTLVDINGDGLPDIVDTSEVGAPHRFWLNVPGVSGQHTFEGPHPSATGTQDGYDLSSTAVQVLDVDGDGFTDMLNASQGTALHNLGNGDWEPVPLGLWESGQAELPGELTPTEGELQHVRFLDYDGDKRIDIIRSQYSGAENVTQIYRNDGTGGFLDDASVSSIGEGFGSGTLELNDMNGDGLLDPVQVQTSVVRYKKNLGWGRWSEDWITIGGFDFTAQEAIDAELEDLNGDALADLVIVSGNAVRYWINRNGEGFDGEHTLTSAGVDGEIPAKEDTVVLHADMNGNGSSDVVWMDDEGLVTVLELFPIRPNLLVRVENGLGKTTDIVYESSVQQMAAGADPWKYPLPHPMTVVKQLVESDAFTGVPETRTWTYRDGFYDGHEKDFRGYDRVEERVEGDAQTQEEGAIARDFDVGRTDPWYQGRPTGTTTWSAGDLIETRQMSYADCDVAGVPEPGDPDMRYDVRFVCQTASTVLHQERRPETEWVTVGTETRYDGYGNVSWEAMYGITGIGGAGCGTCASEEWTGDPCGASCLGDELFTATEYPAPGPGDPYIVRKPLRRRVYGEALPSGEPATERYAETTWYYDGEPYVGLPFGEIEKGFVSRSTQRLDETGAHVEDLRAEADEHGNMVGELAFTQALGESNGQRRWTFDELGLLAVRTEITLEDDQGEYTLVRDLTVDPVWRELSSATYPQVVRGGVPEGTTTTRTFTYDEHGQLASRSHAGVILAEYVYEHGDPLSRVISRRRAEAGGGFTEETITCFDGRGRETQVKRLVAPGEYQASGFSVYNVQGQVREVYGGYLSDTAACDLAPPAAQDPEVTSYDAQGRALEVVRPAVAGETVPSRIVTVHLPLGEQSWDAEDLNEGGLHYGTPGTAWSNGLGVVTRIDLLLDEDGPPITYRALYDELNRLRGMVAPDGVVRSQELDLLGRARVVDNPDRGVISYDYDAAGNVIREEDATGTVLRRAYDRLDRVTRRWAESDPDATLITYRYDTLPEGCSPADCANLAGHLSHATYPLDDGTFGADYAGYSDRHEIAYGKRVVDGITFEYRGAYDLLGRFQKDVLPSGLVIERAFDGMGRVTAIPGYVDSVEYHPSGYLEAVHFSNGTTQRWSLDARDQLQAIDVTGPGGTILALAYERDLQGHILGIADDSPDTGAPTAGATFTYDSFYRLNTAVLDPERPEHREALTYTYDDVGRLLSKSSEHGPFSNAHVGDYTYGEGGASPNAVTTAGALSMSWDATGRLSSRDGVAYQWDPWGRLARAEKDGETLATFAYATGPDRVLKREGGRTTHYVSDSFEVRDGAGITHLEIGGRRLVRISEPAFAAHVLSDLAPASGDLSALALAPDGAITAGDAWLAQALATGEGEAVEPPALSGAGAILDAANLRALDGEPPAVTWLHPSHKGSTAAVTDASGALVDRIEYYPYGQVRYALDEEPSVGYSGKERDGSTGLVYYGYRYLDPLVGRWVSPDPAFDFLTEEDLGRYLEAVAGYTVEVGDPINQRDEDGRFIVLGTAAAFGGLVGGVAGIVCEAVRQAANPHRGPWYSVVGAVLMNGLTGTASGALSGGLSAIGDISSAVLVAGRRAAAMTSEATAAQLSAMDQGGTIASNVGLAVYDIASGNVVGAVGRLAWAATWNLGNLWSLKRTGKTISARVGAWVGNKVNAALRPHAKDWARGADALSNMTIGQIDRTSSGTLSFAARVAARTVLRSKAGVALRKAVRRFGRQAGTRHRATRNLFRTVRAAPRK